MGFSPPPRPPASADAGTCSHRPTVAQATSASHHVEAFQEYRP